MTTSTQRQIDRHLQSLSDLFRKLDRRRPAEKQLSDRERDVVLLAAATPLTYAEIAKRMFLSESAVKTSATRAMAKLGVRRRVELPAALRGLGDGR